MHSAGFKIYKKRRNGARVKRAFSLVELLISIAVISILAGMSAQTFRAVLDTRKIAMDRIEVNENARAALDFMSAELGSTYLTPDSVKPVLDNSFNEQAALENFPRLRFVGIYRDLTTKDYPDVPGAGIDDDGDGFIDEEILDGIDGDYPSGNFRGQPQPDPFDCEEGDPLCIDEDIGMFPSDLIHFVSAIENEGDIILQEISYGLDPSATRLIRRTKTLNLDGSSNQLERLVTFGQFIDPATKKFVVPQPVPLGGHTRAGTVRQAMTNWDTESAILRRNNDPDQNTYQVLAYDIRGLRFRYWYYDYNRGGWRFAKEWDSARETALMRANEVLFNQPAQNNSIEGRTRFGFENIIVNEPADMYPRAAGPGMNFTVRDPGQILSNPEMQQVRNRISQETDGLPTMVEIVIYVQDRDRNLTPKPYTTRVYIPNNYQSLGDLGI
jgi:prepilin-type N-terminal cleavage/methylation domain-containing protein